MVDNYIINNNFVNQRAYNQPLNTQNLKKEREQRKIATEKSVAIKKSLVPRDRIELPTRGFSDTTSGFPHLLKLL